MSRYRAVRGFCYLEPKRHVEYVTELDGDEARDFGSVLARATRALKEATGSKLIYVYIFGDHVPHLHVHLAPHTPGDIYTDDVVQGGTDLDRGVLDPREILNLSGEIVKRLNESVT